MDHVRIERALGTLAVGFAVDGFALRLDSVDPPDTIRLVLEAGEAACLDCLVPDEILVGVIKQAILAEGIVDPVNIVLEKGFDAAEAGP